MKAWHWGTVVIILCVFVISAGPPAWAKPAWALWMWGGLVPAATYLKGLFEARPGPKEPTDVTVVNSPSDPVKTEEVGG